MRVLIVASESAPLAKTGGLGDVAAGLPAALRRHGADARVLMPGYGAIASPMRARFAPIASYAVRFGWQAVPCRLLRGEVGGVVYYLIDNAERFGGDWLYGYDGETERFVFFCAAAAAALGHLDMLPDVVHAHDWQTGLLPYLIRARAERASDVTGPRTVFTVHNMQYQGVVDRARLCHLLGTRDLRLLDAAALPGDRASCLAAGLAHADKLTTVSPTYAREIRTRSYGEGWDGLLRARASALTGIVNGAPASGLPTGARPPRLLRTAGAGAIRTVKARAKRDLQRELGLRPDPAAPLLGIVSRLSEQKGFDLLLPLLDRLIARGAQLVVLGVGEARYAAALGRAARRHPGRMALRLAFDEAQAERIYAGCELYVMPSRFEPCGISQLLALRHGAVPIVRATGGLRDTVRSRGRTRNAFSFAPYTSAALWRALRRALAGYGDRRQWRLLQAAALRAETGWQRPAAAYYQLYHELAPQRKGKI
ncbi:glycogen/starch synthase [Paenibacillus sp. IB182496]|uniref:Glycogen synthase n=1 Tax=Paenibacillus sabuli TaxID=2772509 RepID=A0A927BWM3_9BACL|nr:glycogen/starch synthase [Paenibacillus sabuli]MBD2847251.1 glycogen/starch synthase [Paenibacillus sabuli]